MQIFRGPFAGEIPPCPHSNCTCRIQSRLLLTSCVHAVQTTAQGCACLPKVQRKHRASEVKLGKRPRIWFHSLKQHGQASLSFSTLPRARPHRPLPLPASCHPPPSPPFGPSLPSPRWVSNISSSFSASVAVLGQPRWVPSQLLSPERRRIPTGSEGGAGGARSQQEPQRV